MQTESPCARRATSRLLNPVLFVCWVPPTRREQAPSNHGTHQAWGSGKTSSWICIMRSPPGTNSVTKQAWLAVWKQARRDSRKGCPVRPTASRIRFSQYRLQGRMGWTEWNLHGLCPDTHHPVPLAGWVLKELRSQAGGLHTRKC